MCRGALGVALGLFGVCFALAGQQAKHSATVQHRVTASAVTPIYVVSNLSLYDPKMPSVSNSSLLFRSGPVHAWSDGAQLANEKALAEIGMAPLGLFPVSYLTATDSGPAPVHKTRAASASRPDDIGIDGKDLPGDMMSPPSNHVYYTGEVGFLYGQWSGKGSGDYLESYVWGQAGNDKFQITAGAAFENSSGNGAKFRAYSISR
jgi:hypothetical protein